MGDAKRRKDAGFVGVNEWGTETPERRQRADLFRCYGLRIFQKHLLLGLKIYDADNPDASSWVSCESTQHLQQVVERTLNSPSGSKLITLCTNKFRGSAIAEGKKFGACFDALASDGSIVINLDGYGSCLVRPDRQDRFKSFSKDIDLEMQKKIAEDCVYFLRSKQAQYTLEYLFAYFVDCAAVLMRLDPFLQETAPLGIDNRIGMFAYYFLLIEAITIPWAKELELCQQLPGAPPAHEVLEQN